MQLVLFPLLADLSARILHSQATPRLRNSTIAHWHIMWWWAHKLPCKAEPSMWPLGPCSARYADDGDRSRQVLAILMYVVVVEPELCMCDFMRAAAF